MLAISFGLYHTGFEYPGRSPILLVYVTPALKRTHRYFPSGASMMLYIYFPFMKVLHVDWFPRRHQFSSIHDSAAAYRILSPEQIMLALCLLHEKNSWTSFFMGSICKNSCDEVWKNMSTGDSRSSHYSLGIPITRLHDASSTFSKVFCSPPPSGGFFQIFIASSSWILLSPLWVLSVWSIHYFLHSDLFINNNCRWCGQFFFRFFVYPFLFHLYHTQFYHYTLT